MQDPEEGSGPVDLTKPADDAPAETTRDVAPEPPAPRPAAPRIAVRVLDHPTDWVDGDAAPPRAEGVLNRLPAFDASFFDAPPAEPVAPAASKNPTMKVHTGAEQDSSFGDFVGAGPRDEDLPGGITAAVRRTTPLQSAEAARTRDALAAAQVAEPALAGGDAAVLRERAVARGREAHARSVSSRRRVVAIAAPAAFLVLLVMSVLMARSSHNPDVAAGGSSSTSQVQQSSSVPAPSSTLATSGEQPASDAALASASSGSSATTPRSSSGHVGAASAGSAAPSTGGGSSSGSGSGGTVAPPPTAAPPTTAAHPVTTTTQVAAPPTPPSWMTQH
ncbi:MAG TPA: hypothetical protein VHA73_12765 [Acidimicrobiales bacterium]|jgi:hypothetical protein|nr:hypothetical protein [Acidimicrobiales bacterium]